MPKIDYHNNNITSYSYDNQNLEKKSFSEQHKIISCLYKIKNRIQQHSLPGKNDISGVYHEELKFLPVTDLSKINVASYLYCGLTDLLQKNNISIALDNNHNLILIKSKNYNLIKGIYTKYTRGYCYQSASLSDNKIKFNHLYINQCGMLIARDKITNKHYRINIDKILSSLDNPEQSVIFHLIPYEKKSCDEQLILQKKDMTQLYFHYRQGKLFIDKVKTPAGEIDYSIMEYDIHLPLKTKYSIQSVKSISNHLQIELRKGIKRRIVYLNPEHISLKKLTVGKVSHKPPQNFTSRLGSDPHEKYHAGQPFTSDRKGNFSSYHIPLFSSVIDKYRVHIQSAKNHRFQGENKKAFVSITKSVDPGLGALYRLTVDQMSKMRKNITQNRMADKQVMLTSLQSQTVSLTPIIHDALGTTQPLTLSDTIILLMKQIRVRESISLQNSNTISGFFGVAAGGLPFNPGWFAGVVAILARNYDLVLSRPCNNNISVTFSYRRKKSIILIGGTGQGLERSLLSVQAINYLAVMPAEANLIIATNVAKECDFSFTLSSADFELFATQLHCTENNNPFNQQLLNQSILKEKRSKEVIFMLEAKSELRAQIGILVNPDTYMVMPRAASGVRLALNLVELKSVSEKTIMGQKQMRKNNLTTHFLTPEADLFHEEKIMPVVMQQGTELWCYPLPLIEEYRPTNVISGKKNITMTTTIDKEETDNKIQAPDKYYDRSFSLMEIERIPLIITVDKSLPIDKYRLQKSKLSHKQIALLVEKLGQIKDTLIQQERDSLYKQCKVFLSCYYNNYEDDNGIKKYQLTKIEIRRLTTLNHLIATIPLAIISLANKKSIRHNELLGEIDFSYFTQDSNIPHKIQFNLHILY